MLHLHKCDLSDLRQAIEGSLSIHCVSVFLSKQLAQHLSKCII